MAINKPEIIAVCLVLMLGMFAVYAAATAFTPASVTPPPGDVPVIPSQAAQDNSTPDAILLPVVVPGPSPEAPIVVIPIVMPGPNRTQTDVPTVVPDTPVVVDPAPVAPVVVPPVINVTVPDVPAVVPPVVNVTEPDVPVVNITVPPVNVTAPAQTVWYWNNTEPLPGYCLEWNGTGFPPPNYELIAANGSTIFDTVPWNGSLDVVVDGANLSADVNYSLYIGFAQEAYGTMYAGDNLNMTFSGPTILRSYDEVWGWRPAYMIWVDYGDASVATAFALAVPDGTTYVHLDL